MASNWNPESWKAQEARHLPSYPDAAALDKVTGTLSSFPPLVFAEGNTDLTDELRAHIRQAAEYAAGLPSSVLRVEATPDPSLPPRKGRAFAETRAKRVAGALAENHGLPKDRISISVGRKAGSGPPSVKISIVPEDVVPGRVKR